MFHALTRFFRELCAVCARCFETDAKARYHEWPKRLRDVDFEENVTPNPLRETPP